MDRITPKEVTSMMQAVAQVYEQPEVEQVDEVVRTLKPGESVKEYEERKAREAEAAAKNRDKIVPNRGAYDELTKAQQDGAAKRKEVEDQIYRDGGGDAKVKELQAKGYTLGQARRATMNQGRTNQRNAKPSSQSTTSGMTPAQVKAAQDAANQARRDGKMSDIRGTSTGSSTKPADTKPADTKPSSSEDKFADSVKNPKTIPGAMSYRSADGSGPGGYKLPAGARPLTSGNAAARVGATPVTPTATPAARPSTAQVRGREAMMAAQRDRASQKPVATTPVTAPATPAAAKSKLSIADRLELIKKMRAASQQRIRQQGGTPATPAVNPTPKSAPPSTTGATTTPTAKPAAKVDKKQPLKNGDPMERMTGKGAASLMETYSKVYEEREPQAIDEGIMGALKKVAKIGAAAGGAAAAGKALEKATSSKEPTRDQRDAADAKKHLDHYRKTGKMIRNEEKTAADPGMKKRMGQEAPKKGGYKLPERTPANAKNVEYYKDDADLFDIIKGHFIEEGLTEEEALAKMFELTEDERQSILEGLPRSVTVIPPADMKDPEERKAYVKQRGAAAREDIKRQDAGKVGRVNGKIPEFRVK